MALTNSVALTYGYVIYRELLAIGDTMDADNFPDQTASTGSVSFLPVGMISHVNGPDEWVVLSRHPIAGQLDPNGYLVDGMGNPGVWLVTGYYDVSFSTQSGLQPFRIEVTSLNDASNPVDLAAEAPLTPDPTQVFVVNEAAYEAVYTTDVAATVTDPAPAIPGNVSGSVIWTLGGNISPTIPAGTSTLSYTLSLFLVQDAIGTRTVTWPANIKWARGIKPVLSVAPGAVDEVVLRWVGTLGFWVGYVGGFGIA